MAKTTDKTRRNRTDRDLPVERLHTAAEFSNDPELDDPIAVARALICFPQIWDDLRDATDAIYQQSGRRPLPGHWGLIYLTYLMSSISGYKTFANRHRSSPIWEIAGFPNGAPDWKTVYNHFVRLEEHHEAFVAAARKLIQQARRHEPAIGRYLHFDGTGYHSHARLEHACPDGKCPGGTRPSQLPRAHHEEVKQEHQAHDAQPEADADEDPEIILEEAEAPPEHAEERGRYRYFWYGPKGSQHLYRTLDRTAGAKTYKKHKTKTWSGGLNVMGSDYCTNMPLAVESISGNETEQHAYERLLEQAATAVGAKPLAVTADKGFAVNRIFEHNTRRGIASVFPWKQPKPGIGRAEMECEEYDRHGVPRCRYCGAAAELKSIQFYFDDGENPRMRFECGLPHTSECRTKQQSIPCERNWRLLLPMNCTDETYSALRKLQMNLETVHDSERDRYMLAGNELANRAKRFQSRPVQQLRASAGMFLDWFRASLRNGWLGSHRRRNPNVAKPYRDFEYHKTTIEARERHSLLLPYGPQAVKVGVILDPRPPGEVSKE